MTELPKGYIRHHTLFNRAHFDTQLHSQVWRRHPGMIIPMPQIDEAILHKQLDGLPLPSEVLAKKALAHLDRLPKDYARVRQFLSVTALMYDIADRYPGTERSDEALLFADHFATQKIFMHNALDI